MTNEERDALQGRLVARRGLRDLINDELRCHQQELDAIRDGLLAGAERSYEPAVVARLLLEIESMDWLAGYAKEVRDQLRTHGRAGALAVTDLDRSLEAWKARRKQ